MICPECGGTGFVVSRGVYTSKYSGTDTQHVETAQRCGEYRQYFRVLKAELGIPETASKAQIYDCIANTKTRTTGCSAAIATHEAISRNFERKQSDRTGTRYGR